MVEGDARVERAATISRAWRRGRKTVRRWLVVAVFFATAGALLTGCGRTANETQTRSDLSLPVTENLDPSRRVRQIELYVTTAEYDPVRYEMGLMVAENWRKLGFDVKVTPLAWDRLSELGMQQHKFDAFTLEWAGRAERIDPDHFVYQTLHSSQDVPGAYNIVGYRNPEYDQIAEAQRREMNIEKRRELVFRAQEIAAEDVPYAPILYRNQIVAYNSRDFDNVTPMLGEGLMSVWNWLSITPKGERKVVRLGYPSDVTSLNPLSTVNAHDHQTLSLIYDRLVRVNPDGEPELWAAEDMKQIEPTVLEFKLRQGMKFHDGRPVTAEDVVYTFQLIRDVESPYFLNLIKMVEKVEAIDDLTVRFTLTEPTASFLANTLGQVYILPKHVWQPIYEQGGAEAVLNYPNSEPIGSGPFALEYWRKDQEMMLKTVKDYFRPAKIDGILKIAYADNQGLVGALQAGEADVAGWALLPSEADSLKNFDHLTVLEVQNHGLVHINYNTRVLPFSDKAVRLALTYAIPKQRVVEEILEGHGEVAHSIIGPANKFWHNPNVKKINFDLQEAVRILQEAGYAWDAEGRIYYPEGVSDQSQS